MKKGSNSASELIRKRFFNTPEREEAYRITKNEMDLGWKIRRVREAAGLTLAQLAKKVGTTASGISRIEDADYDKHSMSLLHRVAVALGLRLTVNFEPARTKRSKAV